MHQEAEAIDILHSLEKLQEKMQTVSRPCFLGFDGFTDDILEVVDQRQDADSYTPIKRIIDFGRRVTGAAGQSCNIELVPTTRKIGGNAPIMAQTLCSLGQTVIFAGAVGVAEQLEPLFTPLAENCEQIFPLCPSGHSEALEFTDGKIILGKHASLLHLGYEQLITCIGRDRLIELLDRSDLFASLNWTMLPRMTEMWEQLLTEIVPHLSAKPRYFFVDIADPAKRSDADLRQAMDLLGQWSNHFSVILGINTAEAQRLGDLYTLSGPIEALATELRAVLGIKQVLVHNARFAIVAREGKTCIAQTLHCPEPKLTTGAGDNFNAGYCHGLLCGLDAADALLCGMATAGHYVREGREPKHAELLAFFELWSSALRT